MKPLPPTKPPEKLPLTHHLTIVRSPDRGDRLWAVVATEMRADQIVRRKVLDSVEGLSEALDSFNRFATRFFYFHEAKEHMEAA